MIKGNGKLARDVREEKEKKIIPMEIEEHIFEPKYDMSARELRTRLANMNYEEKAEWRAQALIKDTIPYTGKYSTV